MTKVEEYITKREPKLRCCISDGNSKLGDIPSVSLPPVQSKVSGRRICIKCDCNKDCYAKCHIYDLKKEAAACYEDNLYTYEHEPELYWRTIEAHCMLSRVFRYHTSGEILDMDYFEHMIEIARRNPQCETICFTKKFSIINKWIQDNGELPQNLHIIFSAWKGLSMDNPYFLPECHLIYKDGTTTASGDKISYICSGNCTECFCEKKHCFALKKNEQILIKEH